MLAGAALAMPVSMQAGERAPRIVRHGEFRHGSELGIAGGASMPAAALSGGAIASAARGSDSIGGWRGMSTAIEAEKHTPAPWRISGAAEGAGITIEAKRNTLIAFVRDNQHRLPMCRSMKQPPTPA